MKKLRQNEYNIINLIVTKNQLFVSMDKELKWVFFKCTAVRSLVKGYY